MTRVRLTQRHRTAIIVDSPRIDPRFGERGPIINNGLYNHEPRGGVECFLNRLLKAGLISQKHNNLKENNIPDPEV